MHFVLFPGYTEIVKYQIAKNCYCKWRNVRSGVYPSYTLSDPTTKNTPFFYVCLPLLPFPNNDLKKFTITTDTIWSLSLEPRRGWVSLLHPCMIKKKIPFYYSVGGFTLPTPLVVRPLKKHLFLCVSSLTAFPK